jgi:hypothetical protein
MLPALLFLASYIILESWVRQYYTPRKSFKDTGTQTEFIDLYPDFFESMSDPMSLSELELPMSFSEPSSEHDVCGFEIVSDYIKCQPHSPSSTHSSTC